VEFEAAGVLLPGLGRLAASVRANTRTTRAGWGPPSSRPAANGFSELRRTSAGLLDESIVRKPRRLRAGARVRVGYDTAVGVRASG